ncbi:hypothetical protein EDD21DRAFT_393913 [Dissophora ornata]|nr:hypothetical protein EDD21DRAFT_393913 [Dissophora ornata]
MRSRFHLFAVVMATLLVMTMLLVHGGEPVPPNPTPSVLPSGTQSSSVNAMGPCDVLCKDHSCCPVFYYCCAPGLCCPSQF